MPDGRMTPISFLGHRRSVGSIFKLEEPPRVSGHIGLEGFSLKGSKIHLAFITLPYLLPYVILKCTVTLPWLRCEQWLVDWTGLFIYPVSAEGAMSRFSSPVHVPLIQLLLHWPTEVSLPENVHYGFWAGCT